MAEYRWKVTEKEQVLPKAPPPLLTEWQAGSLWAAITTFGLVTGMLFNVLITDLLVGAITAGVVIGWTQMLILKLQRARGRWTWIFNTTLAFATWGMALPGFAGWQTGLPSSGGFNIWSGISLGLLLGLLQYLVLRFRVEQASRWILINIIAWVIGIELYAIITPLTNTWLIGFTVGGLAAGALTGWALVRLLRQPVIELPAEAPLKDDYQS